MNLLYTTFPRWGIVMTLSLFLLSGCLHDPNIPDNNADIDYSNLDLKGDVALEWYELFLEMERFTPGYRPPVSARTLAYVALTAYEAVIPGYSNQYQSVARQFSGLEIPKHLPKYEYDWEIVLNSAFETSFNHFFETAPTAQQSRMNALATNLYSRLNFGVDSKVRYRSKAYGQKVADAVFEWSRKDTEGHGAFFRNYDDNYIPPGGKGKWSPTYPDYLAALLPHWGDVRTFVAGKNVKVQDPLPYSEKRNSKLYQEAMETYHLVNEIKKGNLYEDKWIADFWSDDCPILTFTPVGRWVSIANQLFIHNSQSLDMILPLYAKLGMALHDAGVRSWGEKYRYNYLRPIEYIHDVVGDKEWNTLMCPDGSGRYYTPEFPTYPSGHATFAAAAAEVLTLNMGHYYEMIDNSHKGREEFIGTPRRFGSFRQMAQECGYSRLPIGVHFRMDSEAGLDLGRRIGAMVNNDIRWMKYYN
ncbi:vanadium-dependent haloperoxidase [Membranicola marinus]|uniref:Vanadium-dependent haloperoxidase n=1 Tax=Membranihabitans marinus TaxID=1227546 RepID=A0A953HRZ0_9BACT|nr:vanadium-dependent haloperoxidase [Membranihabitans marinus]MBY5957275.1 vanadium-dependent haloperoxidase [Membranihabitans marinus]